MLERGLRALRDGLSGGEFKALDLVDEALRRIGDPDGEGGTAFTLVLAGQALAAAEEADALIGRGGMEGMPLLGIPISVKDLFDVAGEVTTAGSIVLRDNPAARSDAEIVRRLREAGAIIIGRTNMTEFAFSGLGLNPHYGTPRNPWDRPNARIPGGSSSGAAISVTDNMCAAAIGTDTGGSVRIPAALCGLVGFKATQSMVPLDGAFLLSPTLDSIGPLARSVEDCELLLDVLSGTGERWQGEFARPRILMPTSYFWEDGDETVRSAVEGAAERLAAAGWDIERKDVAAFDRISEMGRVGAFPAIEAYEAHGALLASRGDLYDPRVRLRIENGGRSPADALQALQKMRSALISAVAQEIDGYDALLLPTVPIVAPPICALAEDADYTRMNLLMLRNTTAINLVDGCAISLPVASRTGAPVGLSLAGPGGSDRRILALARQAEALLG